MQPQAKWYECCDEDEDDEYRTNAASAGYWYGKCCGLGNSRQRFERKCNILGRLEALRRLFFHAMAQEALERRSDSSGQGRKLRRFFVQDRGHRLGAGVTLERPLSVQHFVKNAAETEDIGTVIGGFALDLLWRHVAKCPHHLA